MPLLTYDSNAQWERLEILQDKMLKEFIEVPKTTTQTWDF